MRFRNLQRVSWLVAIGLGLLAAGQAAAASSPGPATVATRPALSASSAAGDRAPLSLAAADFDGDGTKDLAVGFRDASGGGVSVHPGNPDAVYPNTPEARRRRAESTDGPAFGAASSVLRPGFLPDFLAAGDFDADGRADVAAFSGHEAAAVLFSGDGRGGFRAARVIDLPGRVTALATGELGRRDGLPDLAVAVESGGRSRLLLFASLRGALGEPPIERGLDSAASALTIGLLDEDAWGDVAASAGSAVLIWRGAEKVHGAIGLERDFERHETGVPLAAFAVADVEGDERPEIAAVGEDGGLRVLARPQFRGEAREAKGSGPWEARDPLAGFEGVRRDPRSFSARLSSLARVDLRAEAARLSPIAMPRAVAAVPMRLDADALADLVLLEEGAGAPSILAASSLALAPQTIYVVNVVDNTSDANVGDGVCADSNGNCSLRAAIQTANAHAGADVVNFAIPGGTPTISLATGGPLPIVTDPITIDGTTQPAGMVNIDGNNASLGHGIRISAGSSVVRGLAIFRIAGGQGIGIWLETNGGNVVEGNWIGIDTGGVSRGNQGHGIFAVSANNQIGGTVPAARNVVAASSNTGIFLQAAGNTVQGNYVGTDPTGMLDFGNNDYGVRAFQGGNGTIGGAVPGAGNLVSGNGFSGIRLETTGNLVAGNVVGLNAAGTDALPNDTIGIDMIAANTIGGTTSSARNVVSGNPSDGIRPWAGTVIQGNYVGTNTAGSAAVPNGGRGIHILSQDNITVGGSAPGAGNLASGNGTDGIALTFLGGFGSAGGCVVQGNFVGTDATGTVSVANLRDGIAVEFNAGGNTIGGTAPGEGNLASGNGRHGIFIHSNSGTEGINRYLGNKVGTNAFGTGALPNAEAGVFFNLNNFDVQVGGTAPGESNRIAFNSGAGVASEGGRQILIGVNEIFGNRGLGVDRGSNGVSPNDNSFLGTVNNFPILTGASTAAGVTTVTGTYFGKPSTTFTIHYFTDSVCDPSGHGEARTYVGAGSVTTNASGNGVFTNILSPPVPGGLYLTAMSVAPAADESYSSELSFCRLIAGSPAPPPTVPLSIVAVVPSRGGNTAVVSVRITGEGIRPGATAMLVRSGFPDIGATYAQADPSGGSLVATFPLAGQAVGFWDVVVTNPDTTSATLAGAFEIAVGSGPRIWSQILGRPIVRTARPATLTLVYGNRGDVDAHAVPIEIEGLPADATIELLTPLTNPPFLGTETPPDFSSVSPIADRTDGTKWIPLVVPTLPPGATRAVTFRLTVPTQRDVTLSGGHGNPWLGSPLTTAQRKCLADIFKLLLPLIPGADCIAGVVSLVLDGATAAVNPTSDTVYSAISSYWSVLWDCLSQFVPLGAALNFAKDMIDIIRNGSATIKSCGDAFPDPFELHVVNSTDPNVKVGPSGEGAPGWINPGDPLAYEVHFENIETATAPAQEVVVTDALDAAVFDLATFEFGEVHVGDKRAAAPVPGASAFSADLDLRPATDAIARISGEIDRATGLVTWRFLSIDPATGQPEEDPLGGFLPPNTASTRGEGFVTFRVRVKASVPDGQAVTNQASIVFDTNPPIATPVWNNTIDRNPPQSNVLPIGASTCGVTVSWSGTDSHSGIASYDVFVSKDGGPFEPLLRTWTSNSVAFEGLPGSTYGFVSVARDGAGNVESQAMTADATYTVMQTGPSISAVTPDLGPHSGGTVLTITGGPFDPASTVEVRGFPAASVQFVSPTGLQATMRALPGGVLNEVAVINPGGCKGIWASTFFTQFEDVPPGHAFGPFIANLFRASVTAGCGTGIYCPDSDVTRAQMAVFLLRSREGPTYFPPACVMPAFADVPCSSPFAPWINELSARSVTSGCGGAGFCPNLAVTREQMAVFLLRTLEGPTYVPPDCVTPTFGDVPCASPFARWIEEIADRGITAGCGGGNYCPVAANTRGQMAVFLSVTFGLS